MAFTYSLCLRDFPATPKINWFHTFQLIYAIQQKLNRLHDIVPHQINFDYT